MYATTVTHRRWPRPEKFAIETLKEIVASEVGTPGVSHIHIGRNRMG
jgi:hypothetical protein